MCICRTEQSPFDDSNFFVLWKQIWFIIANPGDNVKLEGYLLGTNPTCDYELKMIFSSSSWSSSARNSRSGASWSPGSLLWKVVFVRVYKEWLEAPYHYYLCVILSWKFPQMSYSVMRDCWIPQFNLVVSLSSLLLKIDSSATSK